MVIIGGSEIGGRSKASSKQRQRELNNAKIVAKAYVGHEPITFEEKDLKGVTQLHHDALVISLIIANFDVKRILNDIGSLVVYYF